MRVILSYLPETSTKSEVQPDDLGIDAAQNLDQEFAQIASGIWQVVPLVKCSSDWTEMCDRHVDTFAVLRQPPNRVAGGFSPPAPTPPAQCHLLL
jgi:hypothetical protein